MRLGLLQRLTPAGPPFIGRPPASTPNASDSAAARTFAGIDRELALCGALLHDIGKLDAYSVDSCGVSLNDAGRLIGEIPSGYYSVRRAIEQIPDFPPELAQALLHIFLSHHGCFEHGSPVLPSTRKALVVHARWTSSAAI